MTAHVLVVDQGTTSTRSIVFDAAALPVATAQRELPQIYPRPGWVEHDPEQIWSAALATMREAIAKAGLTARDISAIGLTNQRETTLLWSRQTGECLGNAIVWQDRRTAELCARLKAEGAETLVTQLSGLLLDPYFSATKIAWILDNVEGARDRAGSGELMFGTVDSWLLWRLTGGAVHATDATNASRTMLLNIHDGQWDEDLLRLFRIPAGILPEVRDTAADFGALIANHLGAPIPVLAVAGDQHAALVGQACFAPGMVKATFGTGGFILLNTGATPFASSHRLLTTIAYQLNGKRAYALEGSIFSAGATVQWLRDGLGIIGAAREAGELAAAAEAEHGVALVPAFAGLGAPYWSAEARGALVGLTRGSTRREIARAALESVGFQTRDLLAAARADQSGLAAEGAVIRVDGGMAASDWTMQFLADMLDAPVDRPVILETTALGAGYLAGWRAGLYPEPAAFAKSWRVERRFEPRMPQAERERRYRGWREAVARSLLKAE